MFLLFKNVFRYFLIKKTDAKHINLHIKVEVVGFISMQKEILDLNLLALPNFSTAQNSRFVEPRTCFKHFYRFDGATVLPEFVRNWS